MTLGLIFEQVADLYAEVRPDYPDEIYAAIAAVTGDLTKLRVLDLAAGPGVATRQLRRRGAAVVAADPGLALLRRLRRGNADVPVVAAFAERLPFRSAAFDLVTCATAWHWVHAEQAVGEVRRVLTPGGCLALWWANNRHGDGIDWEDAQSAVYERWQVRRGSRPAGHTGVGPGDAAADLRQRGFEVVAEQMIEWTRTVDRETHLRLLRTHSDNLALGEQTDAFIDEVAKALQPWPVVTERLAGPLVVARVTPDPERIV